ncbi:hypothetical protein Tco_1308275, partial [Tanacetum coccineum]
MLVLLSWLTAMEGLHALVSKAVNMGIYKGATIGHDHTRVSHLIYADDVIFAGHCLLGVCVSEVDVLGMANIIGCGAANLPLTYLGIPIKGNMLLSVGGRISLIKSFLGNLLTYFLSLYFMPASIRSKLESLRNNFLNDSELDEGKMVWVSWKTCLASKESGGLGIGSIYALNVGLLFKWIWRFLHNHSDLWVRVIKGIYGRTGGIFDEHIHRSSQSPWSGILSMVKSIKQKGIDLMSLCNQKLGNGESAQFWDDIWCGNQALKSKFPRIYMLDNDKGCNVSKRLSMHDWSSVLRRNPRGGVEASQLIDLRLLIDFVMLNSY